MDRRTFIKSTASAAGLALAPGLAGAAPAASKRTNILVIHVDQHRIDCLGAYGNRDIQTPNIDDLAADGQRYQNSFCPYPVCTPSRYSLLSGRYVQEHRGWNNRSTLSPEIDTFPKLLRSAGYHTKAVGKMHFTPTYLDVGFDEMLLAEQDGPGRWDDDYHRYLMENNLVDRNDLEDQRSEFRRNAPPEYWDTCGAMVSNLPEKHHSTTWVADRAVESLEAWQSDASQLLMVGFIKPHHPFDPPSPWHKMYDPQRLALLPGWTPECLARDLEFNRGYFPHAELSESKLRLTMAYYYATISQIDHQVGRMLEVLRRRRLYDDTLIVYTADHGDYMGYHHLLLKGNYMYDPLVKVPLIVKWPAGERRGTVSEQMVNNIDLAPTICRAAGRPPSETMHGNDLRREASGHPLIFTEGQGGRVVMARSQSRKLILAGPRYENLFFDLEKDPHEMTNRYRDPDYRVEVAEMEEALTAWRCKEPNPKAHQDPQAPQINRPNVTSRDLGHRPAIIQYYADKMESLQRKQ